MTHYVYILISLKTQRFYIGQTSNLERRLKKHNSGYVKSTKTGKPWSILYSREVDDRSTALKLERKLKNLKSRKRLLEWVRNHLDEKGSVAPEFYQISD